MFLLFSWLCQNLVVKCNTNVSLIPDFSIVFSKEGETKNGFKYLVEECVGYYRGTNNWPVVRSNSYVTTLFLFSRNMYLGKESFTFSIVGLRNKESHYQLNLFVLILIFVSVFFFNRKELHAQYKGTCKPTTMSTIRSHFSSLLVRFLRFAMLTHCSALVVKTLLK